jgi:hypothetical protein
VKNEVKLYVRVIQWAPTPVSSQELNLVLTQAVVIEYTTGKA